MERIKAQPAGDSSLALRLLSWIVFATRPLQLTEIQHALAVHDLEAENRSISVESLTHQNKHINICAGMIRVEEGSNIIRLIHYTAQEYLERSYSSLFPHAQQDIGVTCLKYLSALLHGAWPRWGRHFLTLERSRYSQQDRLPRASSSGFRRRSRHMCQPPSGT
jgi:hypothetical protein